MPNIDNWQDKALRQNLFRYFRTQNLWFENYTWQKKYANYSFYRELIPPRVRCFLDYWIRSRITINRWEKKKTIATDSSEISEKYSLWVYWSWKDDHTYMP